MKKLLFLLLLLPASYCFGQKINSYTYKNIDSLVRYGNGQIIIYGNKNSKSIADTIYFSDMKRDISIDSANVVIIDESKMISKPHYHGGSHVRRGSWQRPMADTSLVLSLGAVDYIIDEAFTDSVSVKKYKPTGTKTYGLEILQDTIQNNTIHFRCAPCPSKENTERWLKMQRQIDSITALPGILKPLKSSRYGNNSN